MTSLNTVISTLSNLWNSVSHSSIFLPVILSPLAVISPVPSHGSSSLWTYDLCRCLLLFMMIWNTTDII